MNVQAGLVVTANKVLLKKEIMESQVPDAWGLAKAIERLTQLPDFIRRMIFIDKTSRRLPNVHVPIDITIEERTRDIKRINIITLILAAIESISRRLGAATTGAFVE